MKIVKIQKAEKNYNALNYTEYKLFCNANGNNVVVTCTGNTTLIAIDLATGTQVDETKLGNYTLKPGNEITIWRNEYTGKVEQIDLFLTDEVPLS